MKKNPKGWGIEDCKKLAYHFNVEWDHTGGSHCVFRFYDRPYPIRATKEISKYYIQIFVEKLERQEQWREQHQK